MTFWFDIFKDQAKVFHFQIVVLWTQWRREKTSREWWRASTSSSNSCCPLWRMARWMTSMLLRLRRRWRGTSPGASKPWQPERKDSWESLHRSWLLKVCPPPYLSPPPPLLCLPSTQKEKAVMDAQEEMNKAIKARKKILKAGSYVYETEIKSAEQVWKVWWSSSLLSHISLFSFFMISFSSSPSYNRCLILHTLNSSFECREPPICHGLKPQWEGWSWTSPAHSLISSKHLAQVYHLSLHSQNGHKVLTLFHHLSCAAGWQARSSTWEDIGTWCLSAPLQGKDSGSRGPSSGDRVQIFDCKWVTKTR